MYGIARLDLVKKTIGQVIRLHLGQSRLITCAEKLNTSHQGVHQSTDRFHVLFRRQATESTSQRHHNTTRV